LGCVGGGGGWGGGGGVDKSTVDIGNSDTFILQHLKRDFSFFSVFS
jgi:hypothetical protein